ncbi:MAG: PIN domain-containing protein [Myxococcales bacterium]|nr:PIN domain-containing protein [Myxococcales bacterium]
MIVADANVIAYLLMKGPLHAAAMAVLAEDAAWFAPSLWRSELRNALVACVWRRQITADQALEAWSASTSLMRDATPVDPVAVIQLALTSRCSPCDCEYLLTARALGCKLVTADKQVLRAFPDDTVRLAAKKEPGDG